ncbi:hypothetical protein D3C83_63920 [compost metagenome]
MLARRKFAFEAATDFGDVDADRSREHAVLGNLDYAAIHRSFDAAFDDERIAVGNFHALQLDVRADDQLAALGVVGGGGF